MFGEADELTEIKPGEGKTIEIDNEKLAAYRDQNNEFHVVSAVCPYMLCILHFNSTEKSWDCLCHGSRYTYAGELIEGPAISDLPKKNVTNEKTESSLEK